MCMRRYFIDLFVHLQVEFYLSNFTRMGDVVTAIGKIRYGGNVANQAAALDLARTSIFTSANGARLGDSFINSLVVVLTNNPSTNTAATLTASAALRQLGIGVVTVGIGSNLNLYELSAAASFPSANYSFTVAFSRGLTTLTDSIKRIICSGMETTRSFVLLHSFIYIPVMSSRGALVRWFPKLESRVSSLEV